MISPSPADAAPSILQAIAALLIVIGLIFAVAWLLRRFAFGQGGSTGGWRVALLNRAPKPEKTLRIAETLWLDGRHRIVVVLDQTTRRTLLLGPGQPVELTAAPVATLAAAPSATTAASLD